MPDEFMQLDAGLQVLQFSTHAELQRVLQTSPVRRSGMRMCVRFGLMGCALFALGASASVIQNGQIMTVFARQMPQDFDRNSLRPRHTEQRVFERELARREHAAPPPTPLLSSSSVSSASSDSSQDHSDQSASSEASFPQPEEVTAPIIPAPMDEPFVPTETPFAEEAAPAEARPVPVPGAIWEQEIPSPEELPTPMQEVPETAAPTETPDISVSVPAVAPLPPQEIGVFFTQSSVKNDKYFLATLDRLKEIGGGALVFNVKGGHVHFAASAPMAKELDLVHPAYDLPEVIRSARERGIRTIGRFVALKDPNLAQAMPATQIRHPKTERSVGNMWVDGGNADVITYNEQILMDLVEAGIDEVNLDYIRYPTEYAQASIGLTGNEKADHIEAFLTMARRVIDAHGGRTKLGISTYAILGWNFPVNFEPLGQDIARFAPLVDVISPMAYPATFAQGSYYNPQKHPRSRMYYLVYRTLSGYRDLLGDQAYKLRPWIQGYGITQKNLQDQIDAVFDSGSCGFTIWNASNEYGIFMKILPNLKRPEQCGTA